MVCFIDYLNKKKNFLKVYFFNSLNELAIIPAGIVDLISF